MGKKYATEDERKEARRIQKRDYSRREYRKNPEKRKKYNRDYWENTTEDRKAKRKMKTDQYTRNFRKRNPKKPSEYYFKNKKEWSNGIDCRNRKIWKKAEKLAQNFAVKNGYKDIFISGFKDFYFDFLARKGNKITAFQVTTLRTRLIKTRHLDLAKYLGMNFIIVHVKPTFDILYVTPIDIETTPKGKGKQYHYKKGKKFLITRDK